MVMSPSPSVYPPLPHDRTVKRLASDERTRSRSLHGIERKALIGRRDSSVDSTESCTAECPNSGFTYSLGRSLKCGSYGPDQSLASTLPIPSVGPTCDYANCNNNSGSPCGNNNSSNIVGGDLNLRTPVLRTVRRAVNLLRKTLTDSLTSLGSYTSSTESLQEQAITSGNNLFRPAHRAGNKTMIVQSPAMYVSTTGMHTPPPLSCVSVSSSHTSRCSTTVKVFTVSICIHMHSKFCQSHVLLSFGGRGRSSSYGPMEIEVRKTSSWIVETVKPVMRSKTECKCLAVSFYWYFVLLYVINNIPVLWCKVWRRLFEWVFF